MRPTAAHCHPRPAAAAAAAAAMESVKALAIHKPDSPVVLGYRSTLAYAFAYAVLAVTAMALGLRDKYPADATTYLVTADGLPEAGATLSVTWTIAAANAIMAIVYAAFLFPGSDALHTELAGHRVQRNSARLALEAAGLAVGVTALAAVLRVPSTGLVALLAVSFAAERTLQALAAFLTAKVKPTEPAIRATVFVAHAVSCVIWVAGLVILAVYADVNKRDGRIVGSAVAAYALAVVALAVEQAAYWVPSRYGLPEHAHLAAAASLAFYAVLTIVPSF